MVTKKQYEQGITTVQITTNTLKRLRMIKAGFDYSTFDEVINVGLNLLEDNQSDCFASSQPSNKSKKQHTQTKEKRK